MGLLDFLKNQPQMADPHANARRLMGGAVQAPQPMMQPEPQRQSILPTEGIPQEPTMTPYQQPQNIGSGVMGYDRDLTGINNVGMQNTNPEAVNLEQTYDSLGWKDDNTNTYSDGQVFQGQGNNSGYIPMDVTATAYPQAFVQQEEVGGAVNPVGPKPQPADIPLSVITGDTGFTAPPVETESLLGTGGNFGFENADEEAIIKLLEADNRRNNWQKFTDRGRDLFGFRNTKKY
jgi:hypothetical protein